MDNRDNASKGKKNDALAEIENDETPIIEDETPVNNHSAEDELATEEQPPIEEGEEEPEEEGEPPVAPTEEQPPTQPSIEDRYKESSQEAQLLNERTTTITNKIQEASKITKPTEEELKAYVQQSGLVWEDIDPSTKIVMEKSYINEKRFSLVNDAVSDIVQIDAWASKVGDFVKQNEGSQSHKQIIGKEAEFRAFCMKKSHRGADFDLLVSAFASSVQTKKKKGSLFNTNGGGEPPIRVNRDVITDPGEAAKMRMLNPREYQRKLKAGKIKIDL